MVQCGDGEYGSQMRKHRTWYSPNLAFSLLSGDGWTRCYDWSGPQMICEDSPLKVFLRLWWQYRDIFFSWSLFSLLHPNLPSCQIYSISIWIWINNTITFQLSHFQWLKILKISSVGNILYTNVLGSEGYVHKRIKSTETQRRWQRWQPRMLYFCFGPDAFISCV